MGAPRRSAPDAADPFAARRLESPRFTRIETFPPRNHVHAFRLAEPGDVDDELAA